MIYLRLFWVFLKIGALTYGGGYVMIALIQQEIMKHGWVTAPEFANMVAISQMTPGPIAANTAVFVGRAQGGILGAAAAMLGLALPPLVYSSLAIVFLQQLKKNRYFQRIIRGIRAAAIGLIASAVVFFAENSLITRPLPATRREYWALFTGRSGWFPDPSWIGIAVFTVIMTLIATLKLKPFPAIALSAGLGVGIHFLFMLF